MEVKGHYQAPASLSYFIGGWEGRKARCSNLEKIKTFLARAGMRALNSSGRGLGRLLTHVDENVGRCHTTLFPMSAI
jgi:hypothetical protein